MPSPGYVLLSMARGYRTSQLVYVAAKLGIADLLADGPKTCEELAATLGAAPDALCRVMRGLGVLGLFALLPNGAYRLTDLSRPLLSREPGSLRPGIVYIGQEQYAAWGGLLETVMTGAPAFPRLYGEPFEHYDRNPESGETFDAWMAAASAHTVDGISSNYEFPDEGLIVDVGGGEGLLLAAVLLPRPRLRGCLLERASVVEKARSALGKAGVLDRCALVAGDFRKDVPSGGDVYLLKNVLHDWDDVGAGAILAACRRAMKAGSRLAVIQRAMPEDTSHPEAFRSTVESDLMQLVYSGGRERTLTEYRALFAAAGMVISLTMQADGVTWLMEARPDTA